MMEEIDFQINERDVPFIFLTKYNLAESVRLQPYITITETGKTLTPDPTFDYQ